MALDTIPSSEKLLTGMSLAFKEQTVSGTFGGGYEQRTPLGVDNIIYTTKLVYAPLTPAEYNTLEAFLLAKGQAIPFLVPRTGDETLVVTALAWTTGVNPLKITIDVKERKYPGVTPQ